VFVVSLGRSSIFELCSFRWSEKLDSTVSDKMLTYHNALNMKRINISFIFSYCMNKTNTQVYCYCFLFTTYNILHLCHDIFFSALSTQTSTENLCKASLPRP